VLRGEDFGWLFQTFEHTAFRLETLAEYDVDAEREEFSDFLAGKGLPAKRSDNPWVRSMTNLGKQVGRVHVLSSPLTDYLRYQMASYPGNIKAGESVGIIDVARQVVAGLPDHDFWLFDDARVYRMHYTETGQFVGGELLPDDRLEEYRGYRDIALAHAVPFAEYVAA